jgi:hypothetical protein
MVGACLSLTFRFCAEPPKQRRLSTLLSFDDKIVPTNASHQLATCLRRLSSTRKLCFVDAVGDAEFEGLPRGVEAVPEMRKAATSGGVESVKRMLWRLCRGCRASFWQVGRYYGTAIDAASS